MISVAAGVRVLLVTCPVEFAALFDGFDWTRVQATRRIRTPVAVS